MKILGLISLWKLFKWVVLIMFGYALIRAGIPAPVICLFLLIRLAIQLVFHILHFIGGLIQIAVMFIFIVLLFIML
jgi:hypothetical protein